MAYTVSGMNDELGAMLDSGEADAGDVLMLNVAGRWTGIKGITIEAGNLVLIESED